MKRTLAIAALLLVSGVVAAIVLGTMHGKKAAPVLRRASTPAVTLPAASPLRAASFTTSFPAGWTLTARTIRNGTARQLSSSGAPINTLGLPPAGTVGVTIDEFAASDALRGHSAAAAQAGALGLLAISVRTPRNAKAVSVAARPHEVLLSGAQAAEESYAYTFGGRANVQVDVLARHGGRVVLLELDGEPALASQSQLALTLLTSSWRWNAAP